jgi:multidrug efflux system membrane fusion protein
MKSRSLPALALLCSLLALAACSRPEPAPEPVRAVRTVQVAETTASGALEYAAEIRARVESRLGFRVSGKLSARTAEVGQRVRAGAVLAQLDPQDLQLGQQASDAAVRAAQVQAEQAEADFRRFRELRDQGFISAAELERRETSLKAARAQFEQARAQAGVQGNQAGYARLLAPAPGVVTAVEAEVGNVVAAGTPVVRLAHDGPRDAVFSVPEDQAPALRQLTGRPGALQLRPWGATESSPATVREVAAAADPVTRTFLVKADTGRALLQLGQTATVLLPRPPRAGVVTLPLSAVTRLQGQTAVWVVDTATMTLRAQPVEVADADGNAVVIARGLTAGQHVVTAGVHVLAAGQRVKFHEPVAAAAAPAVAASAPAAAASR